MRLNYIKNNIRLIIISAIILVVALGTAVHASTITTINGSDTISGSRTTINDNFSNLNTDKLESGDSVSALTVNNLTVDSLISTSTNATSTFAGNLLISGSGSAEFPALAFGDGDTGFFEVADGHLEWSVNGVSSWHLTGEQFGSESMNGAHILNEVPTATNPVYVFNGDPNTGIGWAGNDTVSLIAGGVEVLRIDTGTTTIAGGLTVDGTDLLVEPDGGTVFFGSANATIDGGIPQVFFAMDASKAIIIDGTTNPRMVDSGTMRFEQTPGIPDTRALTVNVDANSQANTHAMVINMLATAISAGETISGFDMNMDNTGSTGGTIRGFECSLAGSGSAEGHCIHIDPNVDPLSHLSGTFGNMTNATSTDSGIETNRTTAFTSTGTDVTIFPDNGDDIILGNTSVFSEIQFNLDTPASNPGIKPTFEFSTGVGTWANFTGTPADETQGMRQTGVIDWDITVNTPSWAVGTNNEFQIRITRTQVNLNTDPIEDLIQISAPTLYQWNKNGNVNINFLSASSTILTDGVFNSTNANATSTFAGGLQVNALDVQSSTATSTFSNGIDLSGGCFSILGTCIEAGGGAPDQDLWLTIAGDTGSTNANTTTDTLTIAGGTSATTVMSGDTLTVNVDDDFLANDGDIGTGVYDFGGATSLEIPNNGTVNANGQITTDDNSGQLRYFAGGAERVIEPAIYASFSLSTTTTWMGTTTRQLGPAFNAQTWDAVKCFTDTGTLDVIFHDGTNDMDTLNASTTVGTFTLSTNNTFTASEKRFVDIGNPASTPTEISCTVEKLPTAD